MSPAVGGPADGDQAPVVVVLLPRAGDSIGRQLREECPGPVSGSGDLLALAHAALAGLGRVDAVEPDGCAAHHQRVAVHDLCPAGQLHALGAGRRQTRENDCCGEWQASEHRTSVSSCDFGLVRLNALSWVFAVRSSHLR